MPLRLKKEVGDRTALLIVPDTIYRKTLNDLVKQAAKDYERVLYVSLNDSYDALLRDFKERRINVEKFFFVDARTVSSKPNPPSVKNCIFITSPEALTELKIAITRAYAKHKSDIIVFDSLSTLLSYLSDGTISRLAHDVIIKFRESGTGAVFMCSKRDEESFLVKDIAMFVDKIIHLKG